MDIRAGTTNPTVSFAAYTTATGAAVTVTAATAGLSLWYRRGGTGVKVAITPLSDLATLDAAHADGGILVIQGSEHRLDLPDASAAAGVSHVAWGGTADDITIDGGQADLIGQAGSATDVTHVDGVEVEGTIPADAQAWDGGALPSIVAPDNAGITAAGEAAAAAALAATAAATAAGNAETAAEAAQAAAEAVAADDIAEAVYALLAARSLDVVAALSGYDLTRRRGTTWTITFSGLGDISDRTELYFTLKASHTATDAQARIQVSESGGLIVLNGSSTSLTAAQAVLAVTDEVAGDGSITVHSAATAEMLSPADWRYDVKALGPSNDRILLEGRFVVTPDITREVTD